MNISSLIIKWIRWRYGNVYSLKPPIGWSKYSDVSLMYKVLYLLKKLLWTIENTFFLKYGDEQRKRWVQWMVRA